MNNIYAIKVENLTVIYMFSLIMIFIKILFSINLIHKVKLMEVE